MKCPFCAEDVKDGATRCPACREALDGTGGPAPPPAKRSTLAIVVIVVVVGGLGACFVVGILATLLMPALMKSKEKANRTKCANNLRQLALCGIQYSDDKRYFPHIRAIAELDGDVHTSDTPRAMRMFVKFSYLDSAETFICPSSTDKAMRTQGPIGPEWTWGGTEAAHAPIDPLADDPRLDETDELSYGWTRRGLSSNTRSTSLLAADRAVIERAEDFSSLRGNHRDGWNVAQADGTIEWLSVDAEPFPGAWLTKTDPASGPAGALALKVQGDPAALR